MIEITNLHKSYRLSGCEVPVVRGLNLMVAESEIVSIFGRSGSGKTTLFNMLGGMESPDSGRITVNGTDISRLDNRQLTLFRRENVGFVFQHFNLIASMNLMENVALPLKYSGVHRKERLNRAMEMLESLGLADKAQALPGQLSGGQIQRGAFARAIVSNPPLILADEPTGQLDEKSSLELTEIIIRLNREKGITFMIATHDRNMADISHVVFSFSDGCVLEESRKPIP